MWKRSHNISPTTRLGGQPPWQGRPVGNIPNHLQPLLRWEQLPSLSSGQAVAWNQSGKSFRGDRGLETGEGAGIINEDVPKK